MHPYKDHVNSSHKGKAQSMGHSNNLVIPVMRAAGENRAGGVHESSNTMQHKKQSADNGMKKGGRVKHHKPPPMMMPAGPPPPPDPTAMAGAGGPPPMAGGAMPGQPPMKRGGRAYPLDAGSKSGLGRLEKSHKGKPPFKPLKGSGE